VRGLDVAYLAVRRHAHVARVGRPGLSLAWLWLGVAGHNRPWVTCWLCRGLGALGATIVSACNLHPVLMRVVPSTVLPDLLPLSFSLCSFCPALLVRISPARDHHEPILHDRVIASRCASSLTPSRLEPCTPKRQFWCFLTAGAVSAAIDHVDNCLLSKATRLPSTTPIASQQPLLRRACPSRAATTVSTPLMQQCHPSSLPSSPRAHGQLATSLSRSIAYNH
jgi:hypothetical protein